MRFILAIWCLLIAAVASGQADSISLKRSMSGLDKALVSKDEGALTELLSPDVSYGHSNGWVQNKSAIINDLKSGKLTYDKIENTAVMIAAINKSWATVRTNTEAEGRVNGTAFQLKLHILEVWLRTSNGWQLLARQSTKLQ